MQARLAPALVGATLEASECGYLSARFAGHFVRPPPPPCGQVDLGLAAGRPVVGGRPAFVATRSATALATDAAGRLAKTRGAPAAPPVQAKAGGRSAARAPSPPFPFPLRQRRLRARPVSPRHAARPVGFYYRAADAARPKLAQPGRAPGCRCRPRRLTLTACQATDTGLSKVQFLRLGPHQAAGRPRPPRG